MSLVRFWVILVGLIPVGLNAATNLIAENRCIDQYSDQLQQTDSLINSKKIIPGGRVYFDERAPRWQHRFFLRSQIEKLNQIPSIANIGGVQRHAIFLAKSNHVDSFKIRFVSELEAKVNPDSEEIIIVHRGTLLAYRNRWHFRDQARELGKGFKDTVELLKSGVSIRRDFALPLDELHISTRNLSSENSSVAAHAKTFGLNIYDYLTSAEYAVREPAGQFIYITSKLKAPAKGYRVAKIDDQNHTIVVFTINLATGVTEVNLYRQLHEKDDLLSFIHATGGFNTKKKTPPATD